MTDIRLSYSSLNSHRRCPRQFALRYKEGIVQDGPPSVQRALGSWLHAFVAVHNLRQGLKHESLIWVPSTLDIIDGLIVSLGQAPRAGEYEMAICYGDGTGEFLPLAPSGVATLCAAWWSQQTEDWQARFEEKYGESLPDRVTNMWRRYRLHWAHTDETRIPLLVEYEWQRNLTKTGDLPPLNGRTDLVYLDLQKNLVVISDTKTCASFGRDTEQETAMWDSQLNLQCLSPETPVLLRDMSWRPIGDLKVGDQILGVDEELTVSTGGRSLRHWRETEVQAVWTIRKPAYRIDFSNGIEIIASADHRFLCSSKGGLKWRTVAELEYRVDRYGSVRIPEVYRSSASLDYQSPAFAAGYLSGAQLGDGSCREGDYRKGSTTPYWSIGMLSSDEESLSRLEGYAAQFGVTLRRSALYVDHPTRRPMTSLRTDTVAGVSALVALDSWPETSEYMAGWLAGLYDTDGCLHVGNTPQIVQKDPAVLERCTKYAAALGFESTTSFAPCGAGSFGSGEIGTWAVTGLAVRRAEFCQKINPALSRKRMTLPGRSVRGEEIRITAITPVGERDLVDITTGTATFVAAGVINHNCWGIKTLVQEAKAAGHKHLQDRDLNFALEYDRARTKRPSQPKLVKNRSKDGPEFVKSKAACDTDAYTYRRWLETEDAQKNEIALDEEYLAELEADTKRWFRRGVIPENPFAVRVHLKAALHDVGRIADLTLETAVPLPTTMGCGSCEFRPICGATLMGVRLEDIVLSDFDLRYKGDGDPAEEYEEEGDD